MKRLAASLASTAVLLAVSLGASPPAQAQLGTAGTSGTTNATFSDADFFVGIQAVEGTNLSLYDQPRYLNKARCDCSTPTWVFVTLTSSGFAKRRITTQTGTFRVRVGGTQCADPVYGGSCAEIYSSSLADFLNQGKITIPTNARILSTLTVASTSADGGVTVGGGSFKPTEDCLGTTDNGFQQNIWILMDTTGDGSAETQVKFAVTVDLTPPPQPTGVTVVSGNEAVVLNWTALDYSTNVDLQGYQIFCRRGADLQVFNDGTFTPYALTCPSTRTATGAEGLDPLFTCSPLLTRSTTGYRVKILQNGIPYGAAVVAIDNSGNASAPAMIDAIPTKTLSFYDYYRSGGIQGEAEGGFCAVAPAEGEGRRPLVGAAVAGAAFAAAVVLRARRRRRS